MADEETRRRYDEELARRGTEIRLSMEDIGMRDTYLHVRVLIDPYLEEEEW